MKSFIPKLSERFCARHRIHEDRTTRRYYGGAGGFSFFGSIARNGVFRDGSGNVRGYVTGGRFRRSP